MRLISVSGTLRSAGSREERSAEELAHLFDVAVLAPAELHLVEGGHCPWLDGAERIADRIDAFLKQTRG